MRNFKDKIPPQVLELGRIMDVRVAGGAVRDLIMGVEPTDYDLATPWLPENVVKAATAVGYPVIPTGLKHGTVTVVVDHMPLEVTTLRIDKNTDGRHAEVEYTVSWKDDAARRDFTINSMFLSMDGDVIDFFNGVQDLKAREVRWVGDPDTRMQEDYLRIMRLYRFCGKMGKESCPSNHVQAVRRNAHGLRKISGERIWTEMSKILAFDMPGFLMWEMQNADVLINIGLPYYMDASTLNTVSMLTENPVTRLVASVPFWDADCQTTLLNTIKKRWKISSKELRLAEFLVRCRPNLDSLGLDNFKAMVVLDGHSLEHVREMAALVGLKEVVHELESWSIPVFPVNGDDLKTLGVEPGKKMGMMLRDLKRMWFMNGCLPPKKELLVWSEKELM